MTTLKDFIDRIHTSGRIPQEMTKKEIIECLDIIAQDALTGKVTANHGRILLDARYILMSKNERDADYDKAEKELSEMASALGKKGGLSTSPAKRKSSAENGKKGGRPRSDNPVRKRPYHKKEE